MINRRALIGNTVGLLGVTAVPATLAKAVDKSPGSPPNLRPPVVEVEGGKLRGFHDGRTSVFLGIPYAQAERFEPPARVTPWQGIRSAQVWGPVCPSPRPDASSLDDFVFPHRYWPENEHCQYLNVWTQSLQQEARKPVMVWLHGGGFTNGSSMEAYAYDGRNLSEFGDVVLVSINHRLNIIGTLDLSAYGPQYANSRQTGMADIVAALQWVHNNIETFGGDPGNVTVFGQSGGGSKATRLLHIPAAKGLFHKVIAQSGGAEDLTARDAAEDIRTQQAIAAATLRNLQLTADQVDELKRVPYAALLAAGTAALKSVAQDQGKRNLSWTFIADDQYIQREYCDWSASIPLMAGNVFSEFLSNMIKAGDKNDWTPQEVSERLTAAYGDKQAEVVAEFRKVFPHKKPQDVLFFAAAMRPGLKGLLSAKSAKGSAPVYGYLFSYEYPVNGGTTAFHCAEIAFAFHNLEEPQLRIATGGGPVGLALQDKVARAWVNFARTGNPSQPGLEWHPFTAQDPQTMVFDGVSGCRNLHDEALTTLVSKQGSFG